MGGSLEDVTVTTLWRQIVDMLIDAEKKLGGEVFCHEFLTEVRGLNAKYDEQVYDRKEGLSPPSHAPHDDGKQGMMDVVDMKSMWEEIMGMLADAERPGLCQVLKDFTSALRDLNNSDGMPVERCNEEEPAVISLWREVALFSQKLNGAPPGEGEAKRSDLMNLRKILVDIAESNSSHYSKEVMAGFLEQVKTMWNRIKAMLAEEVSEKSVSDLRYLAYEAEDLLDLYEYNEMAMRLEEREDFHSLKQVKDAFLRIDISYRVNKLKERFDEMIIKQTESSSMVLDRKTSIEEEMEDLDLPHSFVGRKKEMEDLQAALLGDHGGKAIQVIAVVGMGGVGKTTLCQHMYYDIAIRSYFPLVGWVHVGEEFNAVRVANDILNSFTDGNAFYNQLSILQAKIKDIVQQKKRFLLVLDDVCSLLNQSWNSVRAPLNFAEKGSKILITTRQEKIAQRTQDTKSINLGSLPEEDGFSLFSAHAFRSFIREHPLSDELIAIGKAITEKCGGLPLAIKVIGSLLRSKGDDDKESWRHIINSDWKNLVEDKGGKEILESLYLSYLHLPPKLKACFKFISLFKKGESIGRRELTGLWMADRDINCEEDGDKHIHELASRSLLEIDVDDTKIRVHELLWDVARYVSGTDFRVQGIPDLGGQWKQPIGARHLCLCEEQSDTFRRKGAPLGANRAPESLHVPYYEIKSLRLLFGIQIPYSPDLLHTFKHLRALHLHGYNLDAVPESIYLLYNLRQLSLRCGFGCFRFEVLDLIGNLQNLQQLDLSYNRIKKLPESVSKLTALQQLSLRGCLEIEELPSSIIEITGLRSLDVRGTSITVTGMPSGISKLNNLMIFPGYLLNVSESDRDATADRIKLTEQGIDEKMKAVAMHQGMELDSLANRKASIADSDLEGMDELLEDLDHASRIWKMIKAFLADAAERRQTERNELFLRELRDLRDLAWEVEDLVDIYEYEVVAMQAENKEKEQEVCSPTEEPTIGVSSSGSFVKKIPHVFETIKRRFDNMFPHKKVNLPTAVISPSLIEEISDGARKIIKGFDENGRLMKYVMRGVPGEASHVEDEVGSYPTGSLPIHHMVGRNEQMKKMLPMLLSGGDNYDTMPEVIALVGMGGIGKTILCQHIYHDSRIREHFDLMGWVHVGDSWNVLGVTNSILSRLGMWDAKHDMLSEAQQQLMAQVQGKRFLLVIDDVWCQNIEEWEHILAPLMFDKWGSKILVTTREEVVARAAGASKIIRLDRLSEEDEWLLFMKYAHIGIDHSKKLLDVGKRILAKCGGLPLAIKVIASLLKNRGDDMDSWREILESDFSDLSAEGTSNILGPLFLSYLHLPSQLKACFPFFNFLKGYSEHNDVWEEDILIDLWAAHNLLDNDRITFREEGRRITRRFESASFLERDYKKPTFIKIPRLIIELAQYISGGEFCTINHQSSQKESFILSSDIRHLSIAGELHKSISRNGTTGPLRSLQLISFHDEYNILSDLILDARLCFLRIRRADMGKLGIHFRFKHLHVLVIEETDMKVIPESLYTLYNLVKLAIIGCGQMNKLSDSIGNLQKLRCLHVRECRKIQSIPQSISKLTALEELDLCESFNIAELPAGIARLNNLVYLNADGTTIDRMPLHLSNLRKLRYLPYCPLGHGKVTALLNDLNNMNLKGDSLSIGVCGGLTKEESKEVETEIRGRFQNMKITFHRETNTVDHENILQYLKPNSSIRILEIDDFEGARLPSWMGDQSFHQLVKLTFSNLGCKTLFPVQQLPSLRELDICSSNFLEKVVSDEDWVWSTGHANILKPDQKFCFPELESLRITTCRSIEVLPVYMFHSMKRLYIHHCKNLKSIEFVDPSMEKQPYRGNPHITYLSLEGCPQLSFSSISVLPQSLVDIRIQLGCDKLPSWFRSKANSKLTDYY